MREIKQIRAWNPYTSEWVYSGRTPSMLAGFWRDAMAKGYENFCDETGLKDKNGMEIWEGDLLKNKGSQLINEVMYNDGSFWIQNSMFDDMLGKFNHQLGVIGNIYENPELLGGE